MFKTSTDIITCKELIELFQNPDVKKAMQEIANFADSTLISNALAKSEMAEIGKCNWYIGYIAGIRAILKAPNDIDIQISEHLKQFKKQIEAETAHKMRDEFYKEA